MNKYSWFQAPAEIKQLLILAAENWHNTAESEKYINLALEKTEDCTDLLVAAYRYFYYKNNYIMSLNIANKVIKKVQQSEKLPSAWQQLKPILISSKENPQIRFYLHAYAAAGMSLAKLGQLEKATQICAQIKEVDNTNEFSSAAILFDILTRPPEDDE
jgi:tetratricopeptide (TPR) repeat protein